MRNKCEEIGCVQLIRRNSIHLLERPRATEKGLAFGVMFEGPIPGLIQCDPFRLRQILINLLGNALKFTDCGKIEVRITDEASAGSNPLVRIDVTGSGIGMTLHQAKRLFKPFTQGDASITASLGNNIVDNSSVSG